MGTLCTKISPKTQPKKKAKIASPEARSKTHDRAVGTENLNSEQICVHPHASESEELSLSEKEVRSRNRSKHSGRVGNKEMKEKRVLASSRHQNIIESSKKIKNFESFSEKKKLTFKSDVRSISVQTDEDLLIGFILERKEKFQQMFNFFRRVIKTDLNSDKQSQSSRSRGYNRAKNGHEKPGKTSVRRSINQLHQPLKSDFGNNSVSCASSGINLNMRSNLAPIKQRKSVNLAKPISESNFRNLVSGGGVEPRLRTDTLQEMGSPLDPDDHTLQKRSSKVSFRKTYITKKTEGKHLSAVSKMGGVSNSYRDVSKHENFGSSKDDDNNSSSIEMSSDLDAHNLFNDDQMMLSNASQLFKKSGKAPKFKTYEKSTFEKKRTFNRVSNQQSSSQNLGMRPQSVKKRVNFGTMIQREDVQKKLNQSKVDKTYKTSRTKEKIGGNNIRSQHSSASLSKFHKKSGFKTMATSKQEQKKSPFTPKNRAMNALLSPYVGPRTRRINPGVTTMPYSPGGAMKRPFHLEAPIKPGDRYRNSMMASKLINHRSVLESIASSRLLGNQEPEKPQLSEARSKEARSRAPSTNTMMLPEAIEQRSFIESRNRDSQGVLNQTDLSLLKMPRDQRNSFMNTSGQTDQRNSVVDRNRPLRLGSINKSKFSTSRMKKRTISSRARSRDSSTRGRVGTEFPNQGQGAGMFLLNNRESGEQIMRKSDQKGTVTSFKRLVEDIESSDISSSSYEDSAEISKNRITTKKRKEAKKKVIQKGRAQEAPKDEEEEIGIKKKKSKKIVEIRKKRDSGNPSSKKEGGRDHHHQSNFEAGTKSIGGLRVRKMKIGGTLMDSKQRVSHSGIKRLQAVAPNQMSKDKSTKIFSEINNVESIKNRLKFA